MKKLGINETKIAEDKKLLDDKIENAKNKIELAKIGIQDFAQSKISEDQVRSLLKEININDQEIERHVLYGRAVRAGQELTPGEAELAAIYAPRSDGFVAVGSGYLVRFTRGEDGTLSVAEAKDSTGKNVTNLFFDPNTNKLSVVENVPVAATRARLYEPTTVNLTNKQSVLDKNNLDTSGATKTDLDLLKTPLGFSEYTGTTTRPLSWPEFKAILKDPKVNETLDQSVPLEKRYQAYLMVVAAQAQNPNQKTYSLPIELIYTTPLQKELASQPGAFQAYIDDIKLNLNKASGFASPMQNVINSLNATILSTTAGTIAGVVSDITGDSNNIIAKNARMIYDITKQSSAALLPETHQEINFVLNKIDQASGWNKIIVAGDQTINNLPAVSLIVAKETAEEIIPFVLGMGIS